MYNDNTMEYNTTIVTIFTFYLNRTIEPVTLLGIILLYYIRLRPKTLWYTAAGRLGMLWLRLNQTYNSVMINTADRSLSFMMTSYKRVGRVDLK